MDSSYRVESRAQPAIMNKTFHAITKWGKSRRTPRQHSKIPSSDLPHDGPNLRACPSPTAEPSRLPNELYEHILSAVGHDILLLPLQLDQLSTRAHFLDYFRFIEFKVRDRNRTLRTCRLVSSAWNEIASKKLFSFLVLHNDRWKGHKIWGHEGFRRQVRHVWISPSEPGQYRAQPNPWAGLFPRIFTGFPNLESLYASFEGCYDLFYAGDSFVRLHLPPNLRILGVDGAIVRGIASEVVAGNQLSVLKLFPKLETYIEVGGGSRDDIVIINGNVHNDASSSIKMTFSPLFSGLELPFFSHLHCLSLTGGHFVADQSIGHFVSLCPTVRTLHVCGFDRSFTMRGLGRLLESVGPGLESLSLAIRQSEQLWGDGTYHLCHILARTSSNLKSLHIGEEDSYSRCIRSMSCCRDLFDLAKWENLVDCHLCVYPGRGGCLDRSEGSLDALVESARAVAMRNSMDLGTIIRIKVDYQDQEEAIWLTPTDSEMLLYEHSGR